MLILRDEAGVLRGFSTVELRLQETPSGRAWVLFSGDTAIDPLFWGTKSLQRSLAGLLLRTKLRHPFTPVMWLLISKGFRTYLLMNNHFRRAIPMQSRYEHRLRSTLDSLMLTRFPDRYDSSAGVVRNHGTHEHVEESLAQIPEQLVRSNPQVARFVRLNPDHLAGDELACLALVGLDDLCRLTWRSSKARLCAALGIRQRGKR